MHVTKNESDTDSEQGNDFFDEFVSAGFPAPPVPSSIVALQRMRDGLFSSSSFREPWMYSHELPLLFFDQFSWNPSFSEENDSVSRSPAPPGMHDFFLCGISEHGAQHNYFRYIYLSRGLHMGAMLPCGCVFSNSEAERASVETVIHILRVCCLAAEKGKTFGENAQSSLFWSADMYGVRFRLTDESGDTLKEGDGVDALLDIIGNDLLDVHPTGNLSGWIKA